MHALPTELCISVYSCKASQMLSMLCLFLFLLEGRDSNLSTITRLICKARVVTTLQT